MAPRAPITAAYRLALAVTTYRLAIEDARHHLEDADCPNGHCKAALATLKAHPAPVIAMGALHPTAMKRGLPPSMKGRVA